ALHAGYERISHVPQASRTMSPPQVRLRADWWNSRVSSPSYDGRAHHSPDPFGRCALADARHENGNPAGLVDNWNKRKRDHGMAVVTMRQLLESGVHFGHQTRRWNPKMKRFIMTERNGIYIIDLQQSLTYINDAY